jgi:hypothetical protein
MFSKLDAHNESVLHDEVSKGGIHKVKNGCKKAWK